MKKLKLFEGEAYRRKGGRPLSSADKKQIKEIDALQNDLDEFTYFSMGFMLGRKDMELQMLGFESFETNSNQSTIAERITECQNVVSNK